MILYGKQTSLRVPNSAQCVEGGVYAFSERTSTPARFSIGWITVVMSLSGPSSSQVSLSNAATASQASTGTPRAFASERKRSTSFFISPTVKPWLNVRGKTTSGNFCSVAVLRPELALMTSSMMRGSRPALTPVTIDSDVATVAAADSTLLQSFIVWPAPDFSPMKKNLPMTSSAGLTASTSARGPEAITATVPFSAPLTPPDTGASI